jgi:hypothetical protein
LGHSGVLRRQGSCNWMTWFDREIQTCSQIDTFETKIRRVMTGSARSTMFVVVMQGGFLSTPLCMLPPLQCKVVHVDQRQFQMLLGPLVLTVANTLRPLKPLKL